ncbi:MAG: GNAT family N-acetyltransferase [Pseudonocardia sp.]|nr:GNAT family N-acetyltransferase [Pseudonocardia sp.]
MTAAPPQVDVRFLSKEEFLAHLTEALEVYVLAMGYPKATIKQRAPLWREHTYRPGWRAIGAISSKGRLIGLAYGYIGAGGQWWHDEIQRGLRAADPTKQSWLTDYFELSELHVLPQAQGGGIGERLLRGLLSDVTTATVLLSTPEIDPARPGRAWRLYRRLGFVDVLRAYYFVGDSRPFAVLGRQLPLPDRRAT